VALNTINLNQPKNYYLAFEYCIGGEMIRVLASSVEDRGF